MTDDTSDQPSLIGPPVAATEQTSLIGPPGGDHAALTGIPELTPEEKEKLHQELLQKKELGLYSDAEVLVGLGRKEGDASKQDPVRNKMGLLAVKPGDNTYDVAAETGQQENGVWLTQEKPGKSPLLEGAVIAQQSTQFNDESLRESQDDKKDKDVVKRQKDEHTEVVDDIKKMAAVNEGSIDPHFNANEAALQKIRMGASTVGLKDLRGKMAAINNVAYAGVENINPEKLGYMHANPPVSGEGVQNALASANEKKRIKNEQFAQEMLRRKEKGTT